MKTYRVTYQQTEVRTYVLEAQSEAEARRKGASARAVCRSGDQRGEIRS